MGLQPEKTRVTPGCTGPNSLIPRIHVCIKVSIHVCLKISCVHLAVVTFKCLVRKKKISNLRLCEGFLAPALFHGRIDKSCLFTRDILSFTQAFQHQLNGHLFNLIGYESGHIVYYRGQGAGIELGKRYSYEFLKHFSNKSSIKIPRILL